MSSFENLLITEISYNIIYKTRSALSKIQEKNLKRDLLFIRMASFRTNATLHHMTGRLNTLHYKFEINK